MRCRLSTSLDGWKSSHFLCFVSPKNWSLSFHCEKPVTVERLKFKLHSLHRCKCQSVNSAELRHRHFRLGFPYWGRVWECEVVNPPERISYLIFLSKLFCRSQLSGVELIFVRWSFVKMCRKTFMRSCMDSTAKQLEFRGLWDRKDLLIKFVVIPVLKSCFFLPPFRVVWSHQAWKSVWAVHPVNVTKK